MNSALNSVVDERFADALKEGEEVDARLSGLSDEERNKNRSWAFRSPPRSGSVFEDVLELLSAGQEGGGGW